MALTVSQLLAGGPSAPGIAVCLRKLRKLVCACPGPPERGVTSPPAGAASHPIFGVSPEDALGGVKIYEKKFFWRRSGAGPLDGSFPAGRLLQGERLE